MGTDVEIALLVLEDGTWYYSYNTVTGGRSISNLSRELLLYYSFLCHFAYDLPEQVEEYAAIELYREASARRRAHWEVSDFGKDEVAIALALASYIDERYFYLGHSGQADMITAIIDDPAVKADLLGVGHALTVAPGAAWLSEDVDLSRQAIVDWSNTATPPVLVTSQALDKIAAQYSSSRKAAARRRIDRSARVGGEWWSAPAAAGLPTSTRRLKAFSPVELICRDDSFDETEASVWNVTVDAGARVAEIHDPADWSRLVAAYPADVTSSRQAEWSSDYGWPGRWLLPDWPRLARDWDGVHVSAMGYLRSQGRISRVEDGATVLAGWDPDATYWLRDVVQLTGEPPEFWTCDHAEYVGWHRTG